MDSQYENYSTQAAPAVFFSADVGRCLLCMLTTQKQGHVHLVLFNWRVLWRDRTTCIHEGKIWVNDALAHKEPLVTIKVRR